MTRQDAEKLVGTKVLAWTALNGTYVGILEEVLPTRPWRARVRITGVLWPPRIDWARRGPRPLQRDIRRGFRCGEVIEVGNSSCRPTDQEGVSYLDALRADMAWWDLEYRESELRTRAIAVRRAQIEEASLEGDT